MTDIEVRFANLPHLPKQQRNQHPADTSVAVFKRMQGFKFYMGNGGFNQWFGIAGVDVFKQCIQTCLQMFGRDGNKIYLPRTASADIVLFGFKLTWCFVRPASETEQTLMHGAQHGCTERAPVLQGRLRGFQGALIEQGFHRILAHFPRCLLLFGFRFITQDFVQCADGAFDTRRDNCFATAQRCQQDFTVVQGFQHLVVTRKCVGCREYFIEKT